MGFDLKDDEETTTANCKEAEEDTGGGGGDGGGGGLGTEENNRVTNNSVAKGDKDILGLADMPGGGDGPDLGGNDKLVLDILNDELVDRVREKLLSGNKDLFESCQTAVKAFLAGEPFQEFEHSMYFHRSVKWTQPQV